MIYRSCAEALKEGYEVRDDGFKHCRYCGSMDPVQLAELIEQGKTTMHGSDWKYGWPHKFYVDVENPHPDKMVYKQGHDWTDEKGYRHEEKIYGPEGPILYMKFYSEHLTFVDDEAFSKIAPIISKACGIEFIKKDGRLMYKAPYANYQKA